MRDEYVRKQDAVDAFNRAVKDVGILDADDIETVFGMVSSADVAPVVRCRDCKLCDCDTWWCDRGYIATKVKPDDFCSYGEKREE